MQIRPAGLDSTIRTILAAALALGLTTLTVFASHAGPPPSCDMGCSLDKKCSVGGSGLQDSCVAAVGEEVTYHYLVELFGGYALVEVEDDKLGVIGQSSGETLTRTTTLTETTTNDATMTLIEIEPGCVCVGFDDFDQVTVAISSTTPTPTPTATPTPLPTDTPILCSAMWPETAIVTAAKGQSPTNNAKVSHEITGHIIDPGSLRDTAHRIDVCSGTRVTSTVTDATGSPTNTAGGGLLCTTGGCSGVVDVKEKYQSISQDGRDRDSITFIPK